MKFLMVALVVLFTAVSLFAQADEQAKPPVGKVLHYISARDPYHFTFRDTETLRGILNGAGLEVVMIEDPWVLTTPSMKDYDAIVIQYIDTVPWPDEVRKSFADYVNGGGGLIIVHAGNNSWPGWSEFEEMSGLCWRTEEGHTPKAGHDRYGPYTVEIVDKEHYITRGQEDFPITDELYHSLTKYSDFHVLAQAFSKDMNAYYPIMFVREQGKGRVFHTVLGHDSGSMNAGGFKNTTARGALWAAKKDN